ncbi:MAG: hypothetical protein IKJ26_02285 [Clostridia bacterium]|nr:hypothetical protein [Clostridia bacterium]
MKQYLLGVDGGGTKTDALLCTLDGRIIGRATGGPSSVSGQSPEKAMAELKQAICEALQAAGIDRNDLAGYYAGISGAGLQTNRAYYLRFFADFLPDVPGDAASDAANALSAGIAMQNGAIAIAGTGASIQYRVDGRLTRISGWGYMLGDEGSGFDLGHRALMVTLRAVDERIAPSLVQKLCMEKMGCHPDEWAPWLYRQDVKTEIAAYAPLLLQAAEQADPTALQQLNEAASDMACAIRTAVRRSGSRRVVMGGSLWKNQLYRERVQQHTGENVDFIRASAAPVCGAAVIASHFAGGLDPDALLENLSRNDTKE